MGLDRADSHPDPRHLVHYLRWAWASGLLDPAWHEGSPPADDDELLDAFDGKPGQEDFGPEGWGFSSAYYDLYLHEYGTLGDAVEAHLTARLEQWRAGRTQAWPQVLPAPARSVTARQAGAVIAIGIALVASPYLPWVAGVLVRVAAILVAMWAAWRRYAASRRPEWLAVIAGLALVLLAVVAASPALGILGVVALGLTLCAAVLRR